MDERLFSLLERCALALERIASGSQPAQAPTSREPQADRVRATLLERYEGLYITVDQAREALGMQGASAKAVGQVVAAAGFERRRWSSGVRFAICEPGGTCAGSPVVLPDNLAEAVEAARVAKQKHGRDTNAAGVLYGAYLMQGITAKPSQVTPAHIDEVKRLYPEFA